MKEYGRIGQKRWEGQFYEEFLPELSGMRGIKVFQEMKENDDTVGAILFAIKMMIRQVEWHDILWSYNADDRYHHNIHRLLGYTRSFRQNRL